MNLHDIMEYGSISAGRTELIKYLEGGQISKQQAIKGKCYECMNAFADGRQDCKIYSCPLYPFMTYTSKPYLKNKALSEQMKQRMEQRHEKTAT